MIMFVHLRDLVTDHHFGKLADNGVPFQEDDTFDEFFGVAHLGDSPLPDLFVQLAVPPVVTQLGMNKVLANGSQFLRQPIIQLFDDLLIPFHG
jgi:hypothetical protein